MNLIRHTTGALLLLMSASWASADIIISEIFYNLNGSEGPLTEWIEITNTGDSAVDLENWTYEDIQDGNATMPFPAGTSLAAGQSAVLVEQPAATFQSIWGAGVNVINVSPGITLANSASATNETVAVRDAGGVIVDEVNFENGGDWPDDANGASLYLRPGFFDTAANDLGVNWATSVDGVNAAYTALTVNPDIGNATVPDVASPGVAVVVPEPAAGLLLAFATLIITRRFRIRSTRQSR